MSNKKKAAVTKEAPAAKTAKEPVTYLGPDIKNVAVNGTTYTNGLPDALSEIVKAVPAIKGLFVPVSKLAASSVAIATEGSALNTLYKTVQGKLIELDRA